MNGQSRRLSHEDWKEIRAVGMPVGEFSSFRSVGMPVGDFVIFINRRGACEPFFECGN
jgi:hypothetical protein